MADRRIAFIRMADFPHPNRILPVELERIRGTGSVDTLDIEAAIRRDRRTMFINFFVMLREHGFNLAMRRVRPWRAFFTTTYMFRRMSEVAQRFVSGGDYAASLQIQSMFDAGSAGTPHFVYTDHTHLTNLTYPGFDRRTLLGKPWLDQETRLYRRATQVLTRSENVRQSLLHDYGCAPEAVHRVGAGANVRTSSDHVVTEPVPGRVLFVGADWVRKGGPSLVRAFAQVRRVVPEATLRIVGCDPKVESEGIQVVGQVPVSEIHTEYEAASIFCLPTTIEPYGVAFVEAMHFGLPAVATRVGAVPEIVLEGETGLLVAPGDDGALRDALVDLLTNGVQRAEMATRALLYAKREFDWAVVAERILAQMDIQKDR